MTTLLTLLTSPLPAWVAGAAFVAGIAFSALWLAAARWDRFAALGRRRWHR